VSQLKQTDGQQQLPPSRNLALCRMLQVGKASADAPAAATAQQAFAGLTRSSSGRLRRNQACCLIWPMLMRCSTGQAASHSQ